MYRRRRNGKPVGPWYITVGGRRVSSRTKDRELAGIKEHKDNAEIWKRDNGLAILTWDQACLSWQDENPGAAKLYQNEKFIAWWQPRLKRKLLTELNAKLIDSLIWEQFKVDVLNRVPANATANAYVAFVGRIVEHGLKYRPKFIHYPPTRFRQRHLKPEEWMRLLPHFTQDELDIFTYLLSTGVREANGIFMEWAWLDGNTAVVPAERFKTRVPHAYPLNLTAQAVIERRRQASPRHLKLVFTRNGDPWYRAALSRALHAACVKAGIEDIVPHGLKHTFTSWLAKAGVPKEIRMRLLGHAAKDVHDGYTHLDVEDLRAHAETLDRVMAAAISSQSKASA